MRVFLGVLLVGITFGIAQPANAGSREDGLAAYNRGDYSSAFGLLLQIAAGGDVTAQRDVGLMYANGEGTERDIGQAARWLREAASQGDGDSANLLGFLYEYDLGTGLDTVEQVEAEGKWYGMAGESVDPSGPPTLKRYIRAANSGLVSAEEATGFLYLTGDPSIPPNYVEAQKWLRLAADHGNTRAEQILADMYEHGKGVAPSMTEAVKWLEKLAAQGDPVIQVKLGFIYLLGKGIPKNSDEALRWFRLAAAQDDPDAEDLLGVMYEKGLAVKQDNFQAAQWYKKAAEHGDQDAKSDLAKLYASDPKVKSEVEDNSAVR